MTCPPRLPPGRSGPDSLAGSGPNNSPGHRRIWSLLGLATCLTLTALALWLGTRRPSPSVPPPRQGEVTQAERARLGQELGEIELELAGRFESGRRADQDPALFERPLEDPALFERLYQLARRSPDRYPAALWLQLFSPALQARIQEGHLQATPQDRRALRYLAEVFGLPQALRVASSTRGQDPAASDRPRGRPHCPTRLLPALETSARILQTEEARVHPWTGINHLLLGSHREERGEGFARPALAKIREHLGELEGRDLVEVGAGCGPCLPAFRRAIGPEARLYAVELDPFALDVLRFMQAEVKVEALQGALDRIPLPRGSVDAVIMIGVHLGPGLGDLDYATRTLPWLRSMAAALRPGGLLVLDDGNRDLLEAGMVPKVEAAGFRLLELLEDLKHPRHPQEWLAVFQVR